MALVPITNFYASNTRVDDRKHLTRDGLQSFCKDCQLQYDHRYYAAHARQIAIARRRKRGRPMKRRPYRSKYNPEGL